MDNSKPVILIVDDEAQIRRFLQISLEAHGYRVHEATTAEDGLVQAAMSRPDLVILDLGLPDQDGISVLKRLREWTHIPIIVLSVRNHESDKIDALDAGADDYLSKPFSTGELLARIRVALRHASAHIQESTEFTTGPVTVDLSSRIVRVRGEVVRLTSTEYSLLRMFVQHAGRVLLHGYLLREIWGPGFVNETQYLRVYIAQLRRKLEDDHTNPRLILTEPGIGYRLAVLDREDADTMD